MHVRWNRVLQHAHSRANLRRSKTPNVLTGRGSPSLPLRDMLGSLVTAAEDGDVPRVVQCLDEGQDANRRNADGFAPLHFAALKGHTDVVRVLLAHHAEVDVKDHAKWTPLHCAAIKGNEEVARMLLEGGALVTAETSTGCTPLHYAAAWGRCGLMTMLIEAGANVNAQTLFLEQTPLLMASEKGHLEAVNLLLRKGANVMMADSGGRTSLHVSRAGGHSECVNVIEHYVGQVPWYHKLPIISMCFASDNAQYAPLPEPV